MTYLSKKGSLTVVDTTSGSTVHEFKGSYVNQGTHGQHVAEVADGSLYMVNPSKAGHDELTAIDATTGETHWPSSSGGSEKLSWVLAPSPQHALGATSDTNAPRQSEVLQPVVEPKVVYAYWDSDPKGIEVLDASTGKRIGGVHDINLSSVTRVVTADESHVVAVSEVGDQACDRTLSGFDTHSQTVQAITTHLNTYDTHKKTWRCADAKSDGVQISGNGIYAQDANHHPQIRDLSTGKATRVTDLHTGKALWQYADAVLAGVDAKNYLFWTGSSSSSGKKALVIAKHSGKKGS
ncbi:MAG TPA: hypothetical protein VE172_02125 [Stackebrandtia sp.]|uniref:hypothetical protein n=1 Tax=Stackebrandtia sp. TaxID=2023065 RepID=UPI002D59E151|nr:hypothetical protein [Stackebrandtia sp.]HZE37583.1 hypothetical protein [Stackebrandtia sp.]